MPTNPGSAEAKRLGCTCPVLDNAYGEGAVVEGQIQKDKWFVDPECPIHVDERRLHAESGGEGHSGGTDGEVSGEHGDSSTAHSVPSPAEQPVGESDGTEELSRADEGNLGGSEGGDPQAAGQQDTGRGA